MTKPAPWMNRHFKVRLKAYIDAPSSRGLDELFIWGMTNEGHDFWFIPYVEGSKSTNITRLMEMAVEHDKTWGR